MSFTDVNTATVVGWNGTILRTTNGGTTWTSQSSGTTNFLYSVSFIDANTGVAVGHDGTILRTTDGGANWLSQTSGTTISLVDVSFIDVNTGTVVGGGWDYPNQYNVILRTTNGGTTWTSQSSGTTKILYGVSFTDANTGAAVGEWGTIIHTTNGGVTFVEEERTHEMPAGFSLSPNYPNPFNPTTSMQYTISSRQFVTLKVYDILGREVATLVNEEKTAEEYEVEFDGTGLPSGIYIYQLKASSFVETRKMILLK